MNFLDRFEKYEYANYGYIRLPSAPITDKDRLALGLKADASNLEFLKTLVRKSFNEKTPANTRQQYVDRVKREFDVIDKLGFVEYYLLIWHICKVADEKGIARDYGRGSIAGSAVAMYLNITNVPPIEHGLYFERFISEARAGKKIIDGVTYIDGSLACDADLDFDRDRRDELIDYLKTVYPNRVARISTFNTFTSKLCLKETAKAISGCSEDEAKQISDSILKLFGIVTSIEESAEGKTNDDGELETKPVASFQKWARENPEIYGVALQLEGLIKNRGVHPCGQLIAHQELSEFLPVQKAKHKDEDEDIDEEVLVSAFDKETVENLAIKVDLLSARSCTVISEVVKMTGQRVEDINVENEPIIYNNLQNLQTPIGIFQLESGPTLSVARQVKPKNLSDLTAVISLSRPGVLSFLEDYVKNEPEPIHPLFDPILKDTHGICIYQETMMQLAVAIGFTLLEAETLRRIVGKKKVDEVAEWQAKIAKKVEDNNLPPETGALLWRILLASAKYSFNKSHGASFASLTALTTYLKFKYPQQFFLALLKHPKVKSKKIDEIRQIEQELKFFGIKLLPPDLLKSDFEFKLEGPDIRFGLSSIKGIADKTIEKLQQFKTPHSTRFELFEAANHAGLPIGVQCALIQCGCLDSVAGNASRASVTLQAQLWNFLTEKEKRIAGSIGAQFQFNLFEVVRHMNEQMKDDKGKQVIKDSRLETIKKKYAPKKEIYEQNCKAGELLSLFFERLLLGYHYSTQLKKHFDKFFVGLMNVGEVKDALDKEYVNFVAVIADKPVEKTSQNKNKYGRFSLSDETGAVEALIFNNKSRNLLDDIKAKHGGKLPAKDSIVYCRGQKKGDAVFLEDITDQCLKFYTKFAQIKDGESESETV